MTETRGLSPREQLIRRLEGDLPAFLPGVSAPHQAPAWALTLPAVSSPLPLLQGAWQGRGKLGTERHRPCSTHRRSRARLTRSLRLCSPFHAPSCTSHFSIQPSRTSCSGVSLRPPCPGSPILPWALGTTCLKGCQARPTPLGLVSPRGVRGRAGISSPDRGACAPLWCWADFTWGRPKEGPQQTG